MINVERVKKFNEIIKHTRFYGLSPNSDIGQGVMMGYDAATKESADKIGVMQTTLELDVLKIAELNLKIVDLEEKLDFETTGTNVLSEHVSELREDKKELIDGVQAFLDSLPKTQAETKAIFKFNQLLTKNKKP